MPERAGEPATVDAGEPALPDLKRQLLWRAVKIALRIAIVAGVIWLVWNELARINLDEARARIETADGTLLIFALFATGAALAVMGIYDIIAFPDTPRLKRRTRWGLGMMIFSWTNFLTLGPVGGPALRLYLYRARGLETGRIIRGLGLMYAGMFGGLGAWLLAAITPLGEGPGPLAARIVLAAALAPSLAIMAGYIVRRLRPSLEVSTRKRKFALLGFIGMVDWFLAFSAFALAAQSLGIDLPLTYQIRTVFVGHAVGMISMMPGGLGSADAVWLKMQAAGGVQETVAAAQIFLFRLIFYITPWAVSLPVVTYLFLRRNGRQSPDLRPSSPPGDPATSR